MNLVTPHAIRGFSILRHYEKILSKVNYFNCLLMTNLHKGQIEHKKISITNPTKGHWPQQIWEKYKIYKFLLLLSSSQSHVIALN